MNHAQRALKFWSLYAHNPMVPKEMFVGALAELLLIVEQEGYARGTVDGAEVALKSSEDTQA